MTTPTTSPIQTPAGLRYPASTPTAFSGAKSFVENHGLKVWEELCDTYPVGEQINTAEAAAKLKSIAHLAAPQRYLRAVLNAIKADVIERPEAYADRLPFRTVGTTMKYIIL